MGIFDFFKTKKTQKDGLEKTSSSFSSALSRIFSFRGKIPQEFMESLEEVLLSSDMGFDAASFIMAKVSAEAKRDMYSEPEKLRELVKETIVDILTNVKKFEEKPVKPYVMLIFGINGAGKTTTVAKLANMYKSADKSVILGAADTFRAGAIAQLEEWGNRLDITTISKGEGSDPAAIVFDTITAAVSKSHDVAIVDTAGRLHTKMNLMSELEKIERVAAKARDGAPHEKLLVIDATNGQSALAQAKLFNESIGVDGIIITKLDGTAKGGMIVRIANELKLPVRYVCFGESVEDIALFDAKEFVDDLFDESQY